VVGQRGESVWGEGIDRGSCVRKRGPGGGGRIGLLQEPLDLASVKEEKAIGCKFDRLR
jgi:hypothetical protein